MQGKRQEARAGEKGCQVCCLKLCFGRICDFASSRRYSQFACGGAAPGALTNAHAARGTRNWVYAGRFPRLYHDIRHIFYCDHDACSCFAELQTRAHCTNRRVHRESRRCRMLTVTSSHRPDAPPLSSPEHTRDARCPVSIQCVRPRRRVALLGAGC
jgi:hypothetical protein